MARPCTQGAMDPRRLGRNNSGLSEADISDVLCILHPCSPAAYNVVSFAAERTPHNVLQNNGFENYDDELTQSVLEEQETFILGPEGANQAMDLALRFSTEVIDFQLGFVFGRNLKMCDIVLAGDTSKRISNMHFSIFMNNSGVLMLQDMSTNGTIVDDVVLKGKNAQAPHTRMLNSGSIIQILSPKPDELVKFVVRIPTREGHVQQYEANFQNHMRRLESAKAARARPNDMHIRRLTVADATTQSVASYKAPLVQNQYGMHWSGGEKYNVVGLIGKGAFATVYQLATKSEGQLFAAKELEKRKFMKNGVLDRKLDNEMQIMKSISHPNIVRYVDYQDHANHLYIIMEFVPCGDLQRYLNLKGPLPEHAGLQMAHQVFDSLDYLHAKKITHRDIKPDNILLANLELSNFSVKLSDFGLSKMVSDNETFLKTFCGTLLYCAPEVFPMYDERATGRGQKRTRKSSAQPPTRFHSYSQSVDIWSFGAVLWYSLCCKPPFEGVSDTTGRGMFDKIMMTPLNTSDLVQANVPEEAIALLVAMLNTDPASRPSPRLCLQSEWFQAVFQQANGNERPSPAFQQGMFAIHEEEEILHNAEPDLSSADSHYDEVSIHSGSINFLDPRQSKRFKSEHFAYREQDEAMDSSPELLHQSIPVILQPDGPLTQQQQLPRAKLFGEISLSALNSSAVLGARANEAVGNTVSEASLDRVSGSSTDSAQQAQLQAHRAIGAFADPSLLGAESLMRDVDLGSPDVADLQCAEESHEPHTPEVGERNNNGATVTSVDGVEEETPKARPIPTFRREIIMSKPPSFFFDPNDPSTHTAEYASKVSGIDYLSKPNSILIMDNSLPTTASGSATDHDLDEHGRDTEAEPHISLQHALPDNEHFLKPPPRLGKVTSTADSFTKITLDLTQKMSSWGRAPTNTFRYPYGADVRVPKVAFTFWFHAVDIEEHAEPGVWVKLPDLHCIITTDSSVGILVNGIELRIGDSGKRQFGRVYTGDEVTVCKPGSDRKPGLKFTCEFYHGEAKQKRPEGSPGFIIETEGAGSKLSRPKRKEKKEERQKEKENVPIMAGKTIA
ncbi:hypothetical protein BAUCODRAFT_125292 [Baudoinia panamericana UAMH 10762]|uniref:non-specific serine/threonine protein kinase n=1 Tax=Baudoinia panamericana (strain UAMH 10762) TaxID=717646 RepID=M2N404_BAUPA|nr:uncharacterized protein BAUCODRAFT_125292 [Baudoinia panamericana UAMH 10762]EMC93435.1 hypothetical protein BAUCODRAFT_125292 [Baudoinia panamericana UAMH 10762]